VRLREGWELLRGQQWLAQDLSSCSPPVTPWAAEKAISVCDAVCTCYRGSLPQGTITPGFSLFLYLVRIQ
jgi:hypothetical protein